MSQTHANASAFRDVLALTRARKHAAVGENFRSKTLANAAMRSGIRMQAVRQRQVGEIAFAVQIESVEIMQVGVVAGALLHDAAKFVAD